MKKSIRNFIIIIILFFLNASIIPVFPITVNAQETTWAKIFGGPEADVATSVIKTSDGDYLITGNSNTTVDGQYYNLAVIKVDSFGNIIWCKKYGGENSPHENFPFYYKNDAVETANHEYVIVNGSSIIRMDKDGNLIWSKYYGRYISDFTGFEFNSIEELSDTDLIVSGNSIAGGEDSTLQAMVARLDSSGNIRWAKGYPVYGSDFSTIKPLGNLGYILGCYSSLPERGAESYATIIIRLGTQGEIVWAKSYREGPVVSGSGGTYHPYFDLCLTSDKGIIALRKSDRGMGSSIFKVNFSGDVVWSKYFHSVRDLAHGGETDLMALKQLSNGNIAVVGKTTEFTDTDMMNFNTIAITMSNKGDFLSIRVLGRDASPSQATDVALAVTEGDSGGIVYAGGTNSFTSSNDFFVVKMDASGGVSKVGDFLTAVDPNYSNPNDGKSVLIESRSLSVKSVDKVYRNITDCNMYNVNYTSIECGFSEKTLEGTSSEKLILEPLYPDSSSEPSTVMQGGIVYRYYTLKRQSGEKVVNAEIKYNGPLTNESESIKSDTNGEVALKFLSGTKTNYGKYNVNCKIKSIKIQDVKFTLVEDPLFTVEVTPLTYSSNWSAGNGSSAKVGLGVVIAGLFATAEQEGGMVLSRTKSDPDKNNQDSLGINNNFATTIGVGLEAGIDFKGKLGPATAKGLDSSAKISGGVFNEFTTLFNSPENSGTVEKLTEGLSMLTGVANCLSGGSTQLLNMIINSIIALLSSKVEIKELITGEKFTIDAGLSGIKIGLEKEDSSKNKTSLSGLGLGNLNESVSGIISINNYPISDEIGAKIALDFSLGISLATALGFSVGETGIAKEIALEVIFDTQNLDFKRAVLSLSEPADSHGEVQQINFTVDRNLIGSAIQQIEQFALLNAISYQNNQGDIVLDENFIAGILMSVINLVQKAYIPYEKVVVMDSKPYDIDLSLGLDIGGWQLEFGIKPTFGQYQSFKYEDGVFVLLDKNLKIGRLVKYDTYSNGLFSTHVDSLTNMAGDVLSAVGDAIADSWNFLSTTISGLTDTAVSLGAKIGGKIVGGLDVIFEKGTSLLSYSAAVPELESVSVSDAYSKKLTIASTVPKNDPFIIGGYYLINPRNAKLSKPAKLTLSYAESEIKGRDQNKFSIYRFNGDINAWEILKSDHDNTNLKLVAEINSLGEYCIGYDVTPPDFQLLNYNSGDIIHIDEPKLYFECSDVGSGIDPKTISSEIDGQKIKIEYTASIHQAFLIITSPLSQGIHEIKISGSDTSGNSNSKTFKVDIQIPPIPLKLELSSTGESFIELKFSSSQTGQTSLKNIILKRAEPYNGKIFHTIATLDPNEQSFKDESVTPGITYAYNAVAVDTTGSQSGYSNILYVYIKGTNLISPEGLTVSIKNDSIILNWEYSKEYANLGGFKVYRSKSKEEFVEIATIPPETLSYQDVNADKGNSYCYYVKAVDNSDNSLLSKPSKTVCIDFKQQSNLLKYILIIILCLLVVGTISVLVFRRKKN